MRDIVDIKFTENKHFKQTAGTSLESKETTGLIMGSMFLEVDTAKLYFFNENTSSWGDGIQLGSGT